MSMPNLINLCKLIIYILYKLTRANHFARQQTFLLMMKLFCVVLSTDCLRFILFISYYIADPTTLSYFYIFYRYM
jgi:hypothetical protein